MNKTITCDDNKCNYITVWGTCNRMAITLVKGKCVTKVSASKHLREKK
jgi:hypothetical protein